MIFCPQCGEKSRLLHVHTPHTVTGVVRRRYRCPNMHTHSTREITDERYNFLLKMAKEKQSGS